MGIFSRVGLWMSDGYGCFKYSNNNVHLKKNKSTLFKPEFPVLRSGALSAIIAKQID